MIKVVCENYRGEKMTFSRTPRMWIESISGLGADYEVTTSKNSGQDGENYTGATASKRNIVMVLDVPKRRMDDVKDRLYSFFQPRSVGIFYYYSGNIARKIRYYVESVEPSEDGRVRTLTLSLICPDPKFYALSDNLTELAVWEGKITFPLRFPPQINAEGQSVTITPDASITDYDKIAITGATVETGTGTKSPDNPYTLAGTTTLTVSDGGSQSQTIALPQTLYSLPDGTVDNYEVIARCGSQNIKNRVFSGIESWGHQTNLTNCVSFYVAISDARSIPITNAISDRFPAADNTSDTEHFTLTAGVLVVYILKSRLADWSSASFKSWLAANPITVLYPLATPQAISGTAQTVPIYHPTTILSLDAGTLALRCRGKFVVTEKVNSLIGNVVNPSAVPMGLTVTFRASGTVVNPSLYDVNLQLLMQVNTTMHVGDQIVITTGDGNKRVKLISGGVTTNINNLMAYPPHWLQAQQGDNLYRYNADEGIDNLSVSIVSTEAYWGA